MHTPHHRLRRGLRQVRMTLVAVGVALFCLQPLAMAGPTLGVLPGEVIISVTPGATHADELEVYNGSDDPVHILSTIGDWDQSAIGDIQFLQAGSTPGSCAPWIQISPREFDLAPKTSQKVRYGVKAPGGITGEYRAILLFRTKALPNKGMGVNLVAQVGAKIYVRVAGTEKVDGAVSAIGLHKATEGYPAALSVGFQNLGNEHLRPTGRFTLYGQDEAKAAEGKVNESTATSLPGAVRTYLTPLPETLPDGVYKVSVVMDIGLKELIGADGQITVSRGIALPAVPLPHQRASRPVSLKIGVGNTGVFEAPVALTVQVLNAKGQVAASAHAEAITVYPGQVAAIPVTVGRLAPGKYTVTVKALAGPLQATRQAALVVEAR